jgi:hypothetical protein
MMNPDNEELMRHFFEKNPSAKIDELICIVDHSGSMIAIQDDAENGFNEYIRKVKEDGPTYVTLVEFDDTVETVYKLENILEVKPYKMRPRGWTALYDAIGMTLNGYPATDAKVIVVIITDGGENSSREYNADAIKALIEERSNAGWEFIFLAANQDAIFEGNKIGINKHAMTYEASSEGLCSAYSFATDKVRLFKTLKWK